MLHIAILDVDVPVPAVYAARGLYSSQFRALLQPAAARLNLPASSIYTTAFDVAGGSLPPLQALRSSPRSTTNGVADEQALNPLALPIDGILITGAAAGTYQAAKHPWIVPLQNFIQTVFDDFPHVKMFGSCFGHQIIAQALLSSDARGASDSTPPPSVKVEQSSYGYEMGLASVKVTPEFSAHFPALSETLPLPNEMRLQMVHGDWVAFLPGKDRLPEPWVNVGSTEACPVQGLYYPGRVLTYQGHFEFDVFVNTETCLEFARRYGWDKTDVEGYLGLIGKGRAEGTVENADDSRAAAEVVVLFFGQ